MLQTNVPKTKKNQASAPARSKPEEVLEQEQQVTPDVNVTHHFGQMPVGGNGPGALVQPKLTINQPGDAYEREADLMAEKVISMQENTQAVKPALNRPTPIIQCKNEAEDNIEEDDEEEETGTDELLMRKAEHGGGFIATPALDSQLSNSRGRGNPLPEGIRSEMEGAFNVDFSGVRIHTDAQAAEMSRGINARAFTKGQDIYFGAGAWLPESKDGKRLVAHELTHTLQQGADIKRKDAPSMTPVTPSTIINSNQDSSAAVQPPPSTYIAKEAVNRETAVKTTGAPKQPTTSQQETSPKGTADEKSQEKQASEKREEVALDSTDSQSLLNSLSASSPSNFIQGVQQSGTLAAEIQQREKESLSEQMPEIDQPTGLPVKGEQNKEKKEELNSSKPNLLVTKPKNGASKKVAEAEQTPTNQKVQVVNVPTPQPKGENDPDYANSIQRAIAKLPTTDNSVDTSAGERPTIDLSGEADRTQNIEQKQASDQQVVDEKAKSDKSVLQDFGENDIYPEIKKEKMRPAVQLAPAPSANTAEAMELPTGTPEIYAAFDAQAKEKMDAEVSVEMEKNEAEKVKMEEANAKERENGENKIAEETEKAKTEQTSAQSKAKSDVRDQRKNWLEENEKAQGEYAKKSSEKQSEADKQIDDKISKTDEDVETQYSEAEKDAETERLKTEKEAQAEKDKANEEKSIWDSVTDAISDFFDALKDALNSLFDALKKAVKVIIDAAKKAVNTLIDLAKNAIIGMIKAFGEALKGLVNVVFAAFPGIAKKINGYIDKAVDVAVDVVNKVAEGLKKIAAAILDVIGAALDFILSAYQAFFTFLLDALEFIAVGLIKIIQGLANLGLGFAAMLPKMDNALIEEFLGTDVSEPLPNIERTESEIAAQNKAAESVSNGIQSEQPGDVSQLHSLSNKPFFEDSDVELPEPTPIELDKDLLANMSSLKDNSTVELGGAGPESVTTEDMKSLISGEKAPDDAPMSASESAPMSTEAQPSPNQGSEETPDPDWVNKTDDQKLDYHIQQMEKSMGTPTAEDAKDTSKATADPDMPYVAKTNPLGVAKRLEFVGRQMKTGMSIWWSQNQVTIYAVMIGILVVGGVIAFFTGGAGLLALIEVLMQVMTAYFIADAIMRIKGLIGDFFSQSWDGQTEEGGKSLAKAIAVLISEFLFEFILKGIGKALQKVKTLIKATKTGAKVFKVANKVRQTVTKGVKTVKNVAVRGGKFVLGGVRKGLGKGAKTLGELKDRILKAFGFKRIWMEKHGKWMELWGEINPKVLLMKQDGTVDVDAHGKPKMRELSPDEIKALHRKKQIGEKTSDGVIVSDAFERRFNKMDATGQTASTSKLNNVDFDVRRAEGLKGSTPDVTIPAKYIDDVDKLDEVAKQKKFVKHHADELDDIAQKRLAATEPVEMRKHSQQLGEKAADAHAAAHGLEKIDFPDGGAYNLDRVYKKGDDFYVFEAKGGESHLGGKRVDIENPLTGESHFAQQGTKEYLEKTIQDMLASKDPKKMAAARQLDEAMRAVPPKVKYLSVQQKIGGGKAGELIVKQFDIN